MTLQRESTTSDRVPIRLRFINPPWGLLAVEPEMNFVFSLLRPLAGSLLLTPVILHARNQTLSASHESSFLSFCNEIEAVCLSRRTGNPAKR